MKNLCIAVFGVCVLLSGAAANAQTNSKKSLPSNQPDLNKPRLFDDLPDRVNFSPDQFSNLFQLHVGQAADVTITQEFNFSGQVISKSDATGCSSVVIRSGNRLGARLIFTKRTDLEGNVTYLGRIISMQHGDSYEIVSDNNQYYFKKKGIYELMSE